LRTAGRRDQVNLLQRSLDQPWPTGGFDPIVLSEVGYYLRADTLRAVLDRERPRLADGATIVAAHWRHPVDDYPISGEHANEIIGATTGLHLAGSYRDPDVAIDVFDNRPPPYPWPRLTVSVAPAAGKQDPATRRPDGLEPIELTKGIVWRWSTALRAGCRDRLACNRFQTPVRQLRV
jgi:hypothetical protein